MTKFPSDTRAWLTAALQLPSLSDEVAAAAQNLIVHTFDVRWKQNLDAAVKLAEAEGVLPTSPSDDPETNRVFHWLKNQAQRRRDDVLDPDRLTMVKNSHPLVSAAVLGPNQIARTHDARVSRLSSVETWVESAGRLPKTARTDRTEYQFYVFLANLKASVKRGELDPSFVAKIRGSHPLIAERVLGGMAPRSEWSERLAEVEDFVQRVQRVPHLSDGDPQVARMGRWIATQTSAYRRRQLKDDRIEALRLSHPLISGVVLAGGQKYPLSSWDERLAQLVQWLETHGRQPRKSGDATESQLAQWVYNQRSRYANGQFTAAQLKAVDSVCPLAREALIGVKRLDLRERLTELDDFVRHNHRLPKQKTWESDQERTLGILMRNTRQRFKQGKLPAELVDLVKSLSPVLVKAICGCESTAGTTSQ